MNIANYAFTLVCGLLALSACSSPTEAPAVEPTAPFLAFSKDFTGYHKWTAFAGTSPEVSDVHIGTARTVYINKIPSKKTGLFPIGTIIVKEAEDNPDVTKRKIFAMVKRGGAFNVGGADGWEWFEIEAQGDAQDTALIKWRGVGPPSGESYGGDKNGGCNGCHRSSASNTDFTLTTGLRSLVR